MRNPNLVLLDTALILIQQYTNILFWHNKHLLSFQQVDQCNILHGRCDRSVNAYVRFVHGIAPDPVSLLDNSQRTNLQQK